MHTTPAQQMEPDNNTTSPNYEQLLSEYQAHQSETLRLHEQYLRMEEEYARAFAQLTGLQSELVSKGNGGGELQAIIPLFESLERSMTRFHDHQAETLRVHQRYLETQERFSQAFVSGVQGGGSALAGQPAPAVLKPVESQVRKAEPPARQPEHSVQRPEPVLQKPEPAVQKPEPAAARVNGNGYKPAPAPVPVPAQVAPSMTAPAAPAAMDMQKLQAALLGIVSEKTGYPVETLELDMDMEADLGIDSIKRVEILGAMQTQFPELPKIENNMLAELRTLGQIVEQFSALSPSVDATPVADAPAVPPAAAVPAITTSVVPTPAAGVDQSGLTQALLAIVSEKTGYPVETLELEMDMEADLGIDSIKRVEILGAMQTQFPELPKIETNTLAELRTLGQIVQAMGATLAAPAAPEADIQAALAPAVEEPAQSASPSPAPGLSVDALSAALLAIVSEKTGYPVETLELDMDMEADLGIDSIKRVEILGALQAQFPELPRVDAAALAELRTLGQITSFMSSAAPANAAPSAEVTGSSPFEPGEQELVFFDYGVEQGIVVRKILPPPDVLDFDLPDGHICLISDDGSAVTPALASALIEKGWPVVVLRFPVQPGSARLPLPKEAAAVELSLLSETALQTGLEQVAALHGPVAAFIHLTQAGAPGVEGSSAGDRMGFLETDKSLLKMAFLIAKHLKPVLNEAAEKGQAAFMTITRMDGEFGLSEAAEFTPINGGLFGLVKTLNLEWEAVFCRAVDISPMLDPQQVAGCILAELQDPNLLLTEVGYTQTERSTLIVASVPITGAGNASAGGKK